jgi:hypothetical protein
MSKLGAAGFAQPGGQLVGRNECGLALRLGARTTFRPAAARAATAFAALERSP